MDLLLILALDQENAAERNNIRRERRILRDQSNPFDLNEGVFKRNFRLSRNQAWDLVQSLHPHLIQHQRVTRISLELRVLSVLSFLAHGSYQRCISNNVIFPMERSTFSKVLAEITDAIVQYILPQWIRFPRTAIEMDRVKTGTGISWCYRCNRLHTHCHCGTSLDNPIRPAVAYYNRKGYYSLNVHAICDANLQILNCNARFPGSTHDSAIWELSPVKEFLENKYLAGRLDSCWLIGDSGYPLQPFLLTPILNAEESSPEGRYNRSHIRARNCIERCFGVLKQRFRCLLKHRVLHYSPVRSANIVYTCATLHNMTINEGIDFEEAQHEANNINLGDNEDNGVWLGEGRRVRNNLIARYFV